MDLFLLSGLRFDSCTASYPSTVHMTLENELHGATLIPMHRDSKTVKKTYPLSLICSSVKPSLGLLVVQSRAR